ncbi:MAG: hypothetical protein EBY16_02150 [Gammaproteobacteria bacterium]|nr:hypothetical protein [Gammaproteobacteria bacterium]
MNIDHKKRILAIGNAIELTGNITIAAAVIFGIVAPFIVLAEIVNKNNKSNDGNRNKSINFTYFDFSRPCHHHVQSSYTYENHSNHDFYRDLIALSSIGSIVGVALSIATGVYWVGITVLGLWASGLALSALGRAMIDYGLSLPNKQPLVEPAAPRLVEPSAPPVELMRDTKEPIATAYATASPVGEGDITDELVHTEGYYYTPQLAQWAGY